LQPPSLRFHLREHTAAAHAKIDAAVGDFSSMDGYGRYLKSQLAFRELAETALSGIIFPEWFNGWRPRTIAGAIRQDMSDLNISTPPRVASGATTDNLANPSALLGTLYVLEGASLGARVLFRRAKDLGLSENFGARHLALQTEDKESWRRFLELLERESAPGEQPIDPQEAVRASTAAFGLAHKAFVQAAHEPR
jgi:heme oxygenase